MKRQTYRIVAMKKLILVCGPAAIGKSTWSHGYQMRHPDEKVVILSADEVRKELYGSYKSFPPNNNMMIVYDEMIDRAKKLCEENESITVLFDTTMLYDERRLYFRRHLTCFDRYTLILLKLHDYELCIKRNKMREEEKWVPEDVIRDMAVSYMDPSPDCIAHFDAYKEIYVD